jgi:nucleoid-associated protein EbfC
MAMDMAKMMKQARKMQESLAQAQDEIAAMEFTASAGGGMVSVTVTGDHKMVSIAIDPEAIDPTEVEMLQDMVVAATNEALRNADDASSNKVGSLTAGLNIPGLM